MVGAGQPSKQKVTQPAIDCVNLSYSVMLEIFCEISKLIDLNRHLALKAAITLRCDVNSVILTRA